MELLIVNQLEEQVELEVVELAHLVQGALEQRERVIPVVAVEEDMQCQVLMVVMEVAES